MPMKSIVTPQVPALRDSSLAQTHVAATQGRGPHGGRGGHRAHPICLPCDGYGQRRLGPGPMVNRMST
jgi:hypothetical protein